MKICATSFHLKNILLHEKKPDIGNGVEPSAQKICPECSTRWPSTQYFRSKHHDVAVREEDENGVESSRAVRRDR